MITIQRLLTALTGVLLCFATLGAQAQDRDITYNSHVAQIINENCVVCHREGGIGPMQFESYDQVRPWAPLIQMRVANREMPPYAYDQHIGIQELEGDWRLAQEEIDIIVEWVNQGSPLGATDIIPPAVDLPNTDAWNFTASLGEPDLIVPSVPMDIPANGNDLWSKHFVESGLEQDRCIKAVQVKPRGDAKAVVHHANSDVWVPNEEGEYEDYGQLTEYAMGKWGELVPDGVCRTLPAGSRVRWSIHMYPGGVGATARGQEVKDNVVEIGLWFHDEDYAETEQPYKQDLRSYGMREGYENGHLIVPPHGFTMTQGFHSFDHPVRLDSWQPHLHLRGVAMSMEIFDPTNGGREMVSMASNWNAGWNHSHIYEEGHQPLIPAGAVIILTAWFDNTADNPHNPDPDQWVSGGDRTTDEMSHAWIAITHLDEEGYERLVTEREGTPVEAPVEVQ